MNGRSNWSHPRSTKVHWYSGSELIVSTRPRMPSAVPGQPPDFGSVMAHVPKIAGLFFELYGEFWRNGVADPAIKEMTRIRNARITDCGY